MKVYKAVFKDRKQYNTTLHKIPHNYLFVARTIGDAEEWGYLIMAETGNRFIGILEIEVEGIYLINFKDEIVPSLGWTLEEILDHRNRAILQITSALINKNEIIGQTFI